MYIAQQTTHGLLDSSWAMVPREVTHNQDIVNVVAHFSQGGPPQFEHIPPNASIALGPNDIYYGLSPHPLWLTIFTAMFMHANLLHIGGNMLYLWIFGNNIEDALGKVRFLLFYLACGALAAFAQIAIDPNSLIPTLGASGAIAGVLGAYFLLYPDARVLTIVPLFFAFLTEIRAFWVLGFWIALQLFQGFAGMGMAHGGGVAYFAHIGGFFAGLVLISLLGGRKLVNRQMRQARYTPRGY